MSNIRRTLEGNIIVGHSDVVGASPVQLHLDLAPSFIGLGKANCKTRQGTFKFGASYIIDFTVYEFFSSLWQI